MIYRFRIISDEEEAFARSIEINSDSTFLEFHDAIQNSVNFDKGQLASFYISDNEWSRNQQITLLDMTGGDEECIMMNKVKLNELLSDIEDKIVYVFDFFANRAFYITLTDIKEPLKDIAYPFLANAIGEPPVQLSFSDNSFQDDNTSNLLDDFDDIDDEFDGDNFENIDDYNDRF